MRRDLALLLALLVAVPARADKTAVLEVRAEGLEGGAEDRFSKALIEGLRAASYDVIEPEKVDATLARTTMVEGCLFGPCLAGIGGALGAQQVVVARVTAVGRSYSFVLTMVSTASGLPIAQVADSCDVCTLDEALAQMTLSIVSLSASGSPSGVLPVPIRPSPCDAAAPVRRRARLTGWLLTGAAVVAVAAGGALYALDHRDGAYLTGAGAGGLLLGGILTFTIP